MAARRWSQRMRAWSGYGMLAPSPALQRLLASRVYRCQEGYRPEKYRDTQGWCQGGNCSSSYGMVQIQTATQCRHTIGERIAAHHPGEPERHAGHWKKGAGEQPQRQQEQIHDGVKALRGLHTPGNDQTKIGHAKGDAKEDHYDQQER